MPLKPSSISVVLPSYNERDNIVEAIERIEKTLGGSLLEVVIVDDDSPDRTWELVEQLRHPKVRLMRRIDRKGLASALSDGTQAARGEYVVWLDCDLGIPPEDIMRLVEELPYYEVAIGSRYMPGGMDTRPKFRAFLSWIFNMYARVILGFGFRDWTSGFAAARKSALKKVPLSPDGFGEYFIEWIFSCRRARLSITEVAYRYGLRKAGLSKTDAHLRIFLRLGFNYAMRVLLVRIRGGQGRRL